MVREGVKKTIESVIMITLYHGLAILREVTFVNVTSVAENTDTLLGELLHHGGKREPCGHMIW